MSNADGNGRLSSRRGGEALKQAQGQSTLVSGIAFAWFGHGQAQQRESLKLQPFFESLVYTGITASAGPYSAGDIQALANQFVLSDPEVSYNLSPINQYVVHAWPHIFGILEDTDFILGSLGLPGDMQEVQTNLVVDGVRLRVARSDNLIDATLAGGSIPFIVDL